MRGKEIVNDMILVNLFFTGVIVSTLEDKTDIAEFQEDMKREFDSKLEVYMTKDISDSCTSDS